MKFAYVLIPFAVLGLAFGLAKVLMFLRSKNMQILAAKWGFHYIGPPASKLFSPSSEKIKLPLSASFHRGWYPANEIKQVWNVIEGRRNGISILIFDSIIGEGKGAYCTFLACQTEQNPFGTDTSPDHLVQSGGWTALYRLRFLQITWTMGVKAIEVRLNTLFSGPIN